MTVEELVLTELAPATTRAEALAPPADAARISWVARYRGLLVLADLVVAVLVPLAISVSVLGRPHLGVMVGVPIGWLAVAAVCGCYDGDVLAPRARELRKVMVTGLCLIAALPLVAILTDRYANQDLAVGAIAVTSVGALGVRSIARVNLRRLRRAGRCVQHVALVGDADLAEKLVKRLRASRSAVVTPAALALPAGSRDISDLLGLPVLGNVDEPDELVASILAHGIDTVLLVPGTTADADMLRRIARACEWSGVRLLYAPAVVDVAASTPVVPVAGVPVLRVPRPGPAGAGRLLKDVMDRLGAGIGLVLASPLLAFLALAVWLDDGGPILFRQRRVGASGRIFTIYKFRTMFVGAENALPALRVHNECDGPLFKMKDDPRVTRVGRVLRSCSMDELPQLINVFRGDMSLVGPRPPLEHEVEQYVSAERRRLLVKPGLTGLSQVSGRSHLSWDQSVQLDLSYVESWSLPLDLRIVAKTVPAVVRRHGAF